MVRDVWQVNVHDLLPESQRQVKDWTGIDSVILLRDKHSPKAEEWWLMVDMSGRMEVTAGHGSWRTKLMTAWILCEQANMIFSKHSCVLRGLGEVTHHGLQAFLAPGVRGIL
jgi:hypothetical protein